MATMGNMSKRIYCCKCALSRVSQRVGPIRGAKSEVTLTLGAQAFIGQYVTDWDSVLAAFSLSISRGKRKSFMFWKWPSLRQGVIVSKFLQSYSRSGWR